MVNSWSGFEISFDTDGFCMNSMNAHKNPRHCRGLTVLITGAMFLPGIVHAQSVEKIFPADAVIDITKAPYSAKPDDGIDDTTAIQQAVTDHVGHGRTIYFPAGVYDISGPIVAKTKDGIWEAHLTIQGASRDKTILKLKDNAPGFSDETKPLAVYSSGNHWGEGDDLAGGGNKAFRNCFFDFTLDTGSGNPAAIGIEWANSNQGTIRDVTVRSGDGAGASGIAMKRKIPGPGYIKNVLVEGFDAGIDVADGQYGFTLEDVRVTGQRDAGIRLHDNVLHIHRYTSDTDAPAILATGGISAVTLVGSRIGGASDASDPAISSAGTTLLRTVNIADENNGKVLLKNIEIRPQELALQPADRPDQATRFRIIPQAYQPGPQKVYPLQNALIDPVQTPDFWNPNLADWEKVGPRRDGEADDTQAIQRALDSGKSTIYFVNDRIYHLSDTLIVRGNVKQVIGFGAELNLGTAKEPFSNKENPKPLIRIDETDHDTVFFERMFFNAQYPGEVLFENNSPKTVVIKHSMGWVGNEGLCRTYQNTEKAYGSKVFIEDCFLPGWAFTKQTVFARQLNPENYEGDGKTSQVTNDGGKLWILGFKTEGPAPFITTLNGGETELLGAYNYLNATKMPVLPKDAVPYSVADGKMSLTFVAENFRDNDYDVYIRETRDGKVVTELKHADLPPRNGNKGDRSTAVPLWRSRGDIARQE